MCPECGSPAVALVSPVFSASPASPCVCKACGWEGNKNQLVGIPFSHDWGSDEGLIEALMSDLRVLLAKEVGKTFVGFLIRWGFMPSPDSKLLARYLSRIAKAVIEAVLNERLELEKERIRERTN
jgi:hypothetical protein